MPASSAASTTRFGRGLVDPTAEVVAPEADHRGVELADAACFHAVSVPRRSGRARFVGGARVVAREQQIGRAHRAAVLLRADRQPRDHAADHRETRADAQRDRDLCR